MSLLGTWLAGGTADAAVEMTDDRISAATFARRDGRAIVSAHASEPLPPGVVVPSFTASNVPSPASVSATLRRVLDRLPSRPSRVALVVPDSVAKVSLVRFDQVPPRRGDLDQLVRWQMRKSLPFSIDEAAVSYTPGLRVGDAGREYLVVAARRSIVAEYEGVCAAVGAHAGIVDLATLSLINMFLASQSAPEGDWLLVHVRRDSTSIVILRGDEVVFYRNRAEGEEQSLTDLVYQTAMYYQDRLAGAGFTRVLVGGADPRTIAAARHSLEAHLGLMVDPVEPEVAFADRISSSPDLTDVIGPLVGIALRHTAETAA
jgi:type IV pilus assembly protein PilM